MKHASLDQVEGDWLSILDDVDGAFWATLSVPSQHDTDDSADLSDGIPFRDGEDEEDLEVTAERQHPEQRRVFRTEDEAQRFLKYAIAKGHVEASMAIESGTFAVRYRAVTPLKGYRAGRRYSAREAKFILREYLLWSTVASIADEVERPESAVKIWLRSRGLRLSEPIDSFGTADDSNQVGDVEDAFFAHGELDPQAVGSEADQVGLLRKYEETGRLDLLCDRALDLQRAELAFIAALQFRDPIRALHALSMFQPLPRALKKVRQATLHFLRADTSSKLGRFLLEWSICERKRRKDYSYTNGSDLPEADAKALARALSLAMKSQVHEWSSALKALHAMLSGEWQTLQSGVDRGDQVCAVVLAHELRRTISLCFQSNQTSDSTERHLADLEPVASDCFVDTGLIFDEARRGMPYEERLASAVSLRLHGLRPL